MAKHIAGDSIAEVWDELLLNLLMRGETCSPRGKTTKEILNVTIEVRQGLNNVLVNPVRDLNHRFMVAEWLWILAGLNEVGTLAKYNSTMKTFSDDGEILSGAYGPRLMPQIPYVLKALKDPQTRQAVATIWTPSPNDSKDIACTISLQWLIRGGFLHCTANMRSSDVWLGLPYDFFTFSQITNYIALLIGRPVGSMTMNLASSHLYQEHHELASTIMASKNSTFVPSPHLPRAVQTPTSEQIEYFLKNPPPQTYRPENIWANYFFALGKNKSFALEVLSGLAKAF